MNKAFFKSCMSMEPANKKEAYIFISDSEQISKAIILAGFKAVYLEKEDSESWFSVESFLSYLDEIAYQKPCRTSYVYVTSCSNKKRNDALEQYFKAEGLETRQGWKLFKNREYLANSNKSEELKKMLEGFVKRYEGNAGGSMLNIDQNTEMQQANVRDLLSYKINYSNDGNEKSRKVLQTVRNFEIVLENDSRFAGKIKFDEFSQQAYLMGTVPWELSKNNYRAWSSYDDSALFAILQSDYGLTSRSDYFDAVKNIAMRNKFHPVRDILNGLVWDGQEHIRNLLPDYLGVEDSDYQYEVMRLWMLGAVSRIYKPGCKFDYTIVFEGRQGLGKSTFLRLMALNDNWFNDNLDSLDSDRAAQLLAGSWIVELAELKSLTRTIGGPDSVKRFLTATQDKYRVPYERRPDTFLRQCVFAGTTNKYDFLTDETGNRRFLIIECGMTEQKKSLFNPESIDDFKAAWAQAVHIMKEENPKLILPESCLKQAEDLQAASMADDGKVGLIQEYLSGKQRTCAIEIWREALQEPGRPQKWQASEIGNLILSLPGWKRMQSPGRFGEYGRQRGFQKYGLQSPETNGECRQDSGECRHGFVSIDDSNLSELPFD